MLFLDTNICLKLQEKIFQEPFYISSVTLLELENIKTSNRKDDSIKYNARHIVRLLDENSDKYSVVVYNNKCKAILDDFGLDNTIPDNQICACAKMISETENVVFCSNDICCKTIAREIFGLTVQDTNDNTEDVYKGYRLIRGNTDKINKEMESLDLSNWVVNEYLIIQNTDDHSEKEMRFDGEKFVALKLPPSKFIKAKNSLQRCALDILMNPDITIAAILGGYGSGKSYLTTRMGVYHVVEKGNQGKIIGIRSPQGEGKEVGFLPGDLEDKTDLFFQPIIQQLEGGEFELNSLKQKGMIESTIPYYLKGMTFADSIMVVDEAEDLTEKEIRLIGTRVGKNSRIFLDGDYKQSITNTSQTNPLVKMCKEFKGNPMFATIYLESDVRSDTSKLFATLFEK